VDVITDKGMIRGYQYNNMFYFLGVPYARSPEGNLRWRAPQPHNSWNDVLYTTDFSSSCLQKFDAGYTFPANVTFKEDCLYLNIWVPDTPTPNKAVMVWFHGGGLSRGGNSEYRLRGEYMSSSADVIVINVNYRLGTIGWLAHPGFSLDDPNHPTTGNYGFLDQQMSLMWIQNNIHLFGGDPSAVTIMGESAGGSSVCYHMVAPSSKGLFSAAIIESGACFSETISLKEAEKNAINIQNILNCTGNMEQVVTCMRAVSSEKMLNVPVVSSAVVDGLDFVNHPYFSMANQKVHVVPLIAGNVLNEGSTFTSIQRPVDSKTYASALKQMYPDYDSQILTVYPCEAYNASDCWYALTAVIGDALLVCPTMLMANLIAPQVKTYTYVFSHIPLWGNESLPGKGAFHSSEISFVFSTLPNIYPHTPEEVGLAHLMTQFWTTFGKTHDPNGQTPVQWPQYMVSTQYPRIALNNPVEVLHGYKEKECNLWDGLFKILYSY